ncbi:hypothetical protein U0C82_12660 [Fulvimarina sp. 2208YS6-2-32]|uniref:DUF3551 domain-containing protein n=1 Tax=Fulvimarina uroteuthidis TaxID=3098149 RepID=A0ABU5I460_9HYPH|nr:hypothetical protein [Fulvimarina sp. 2208YS6-2-32]MDY8109991.1 hypothetical protein [Fulvimarina sp. 2208YS6-2-32]
MIKRLSFFTVLIALFGMAMSALAQNTVERSGSALASVSGDRCDYTQGIVCTIERAPAPLSVTASF